MVRQVADIALARALCRCAALCLLAVLAAAPAGAQDKVEDKVQGGINEAVAQPEPKPQMLIAKPESNPLLPRPRPDPENIERPAAPQQAGGGTDQMTTGAVPAPEDGEQEACLWRLRALGVAVSPQPPNDEEGGCQVASPLVISELSLDISVYPDATLTCLAAEALAKWVTEIVVPAAREHLDAEPAGLVQSSSYACTAQNPAPRAREHASGSAIDITGIIFKERDTLAIRMRDAETGPERAFQSAIRNGACRYFTNVTGPGSEAGYDGKLHLGAARGTGASRVCR